MKYKILISTLLVITHCTFVFAQKEGNNWYFGRNAGINFNGAEPVALTDGAQYTIEGCASISDNFGRLLFYSDGESIWNKNHIKMDSGSGLLGSVNSTQAAIIVKRPSSKNLYYIFTTDDKANPDGLRYSELDMNLDGGLGNVTNNKNVLMVAPVTENVTLVRHSNSIDFWIVTHLFGSNTFHCYLLDSAGINATPTITNVGLDISGSTINARGYLKASADGKYLGMTHSKMGTAEIFNFNNSNGQLSNGIILDNFLRRRPYGLEFSPAGNKLYIGETQSPANVYQYDLSNGLIGVENSQRLISARTQVGGALQVGPDNKIYQAIYGSNNLSVINDPNETGDACNYDSAGISLQGKSVWFGLPIFYNSIYIQAAFKYEDVCFGDSTYFQLTSLIGDSVFWNFGDIESGIYNTSNLQNPKHLFTDTGFYEVSLVVSYQELLDTVRDSVYIDKIPEANLLGDTTMCFLDTFITIEMPSDGLTSYKWNGNSSGLKFDIKTEGKYYVVASRKGCLASDTVNITEDCEVILIMPNIFTPNGDDVNDVFKSNEIKGVESIDVLIYNKWGMTVYESDELSFNWKAEGKDGLTPTDGVYFWNINFKGIDGKDYIQKGTVTLMH